MDNCITILTFNILAQIFVNDKIGGYPKESNPYLDRNYRLKRILKFLSDARYIDILCLQEISEYEYNYISQTMTNYNCFITYHSKTHWSDQLYTPQWEPNGVAILIKKRKFTNTFSQDIQIGPNGSKMCIVYAKHVSSNQKIRIASIHLDETKEIQLAEIDSIMQSFKFQSDMIDIIAGDTNAVDHEVGDKFLSHNFADTGVDNDSTPTHPFTCNPLEKWAIIDRIYVRNIDIVNGLILDLNLCEKSGNDMGTRVVKTLQTFGSDHFPVQATLKLN